MLQTKFKLIRNMNNFNAKENYADFSALPFPAINRFEDSDDQLAVLNRLILDCFYRNPPLKKTKFTRLPAPRMKEIDVIVLQNKDHKYRLLVHGSRSKENWTNFRNYKNELKKKIENTKSSFYKTVLTLKNTKEILKIVRRVLNLNEKALNAHINVSRNI